MRGNTLKIPALVVPIICDPLTSRPITHCKERYGHLRGIRLADEAEDVEVLKVDVLIGSDDYWNLVTGRVKKARERPKAIDSRVGWYCLGLMRDKTCQ